MKQEVDLDIEEQKTIASLTTAVSFDSLLTDDVRK